MEYYLFIQCGNCGQSMRYLLDGLNGRPKHFDETFEQFVKDLYSPNRACDYCGDLITTCFDCMPLIPEICRRCLTNPFRHVETLLDQATTSENIRKNENGQSK